jgi:CRISPR-associated protein Cas4
MTVVGEAGVVLVPARMVNEFVYCPRLAFLEWVQGEWADNLDTIQGRWVHRTVDVSSPRAVPAGDEDPELARELTARSLLLSSEDEQVIARIDLLEISGSAVTPVEYKKGSPPDNVHRAYDPERVQLAVQALILRANGFGVSAGVLYYAESKTRVDVPMNDELVALARSAIEGVLAMAERAVCPPPLVDSPKCTRCSLNSICLPDETNLLAGLIDTSSVRRLVAPRPVSRPLYVQEQGSIVKKQGEALVVTAPGQDPVKVPGKDISAVVLHGNVQITTQALRALMDDDVPVSFHSFGGWYVGCAGAGIGHHALRRNPRHALRRNPRHALRRNPRHALRRNPRHALRRNRAAAQPPPLARKCVWSRFSDQTQAGDDQRRLHGGNSGVLNTGAVDPALARPQHKAAYGTATRKNLAAAYVFGLARNHGYADANKRTAFLRLNGRRVEARADRAEVGQRRTGRATDDGERERRAKDPPVWQMQHRRVARPSLDTATSSSARRMPKTREPRLQIASVADHGRRDGHVAVGGRAQPSGPSVDSRWYISELPARQ